MFKLLVDGEYLCITNSIDTPTWRNDHNFYGYILYDWVESISRLYGIKDKLHNEKEHDGEGDFMILETMPSIFITYAYIAHYLDI